MASAEAVQKRKAKEQQAGAQSPVQQQNLADANAQQEILHPKEVELSLFGDKVKLFPLPAKWSLRFAGFAVRMIGAAEKTGYGEPVLRVGSVLAERGIDDFLPYVARSLNPTDTPVSDAQMAAILAEIDSKIDASQFASLAEAFLAMTDLNKTVDSIRQSIGATGAKN